ncbi:MAG: (Fe-S)-binding protein [Firmicutes bacterium]|nr:(Fe-S)-binding protein [Bacillota bacterium]
MKGHRLESIKISDIDMDKCYFNPGCALTTHNPESEKKILKILNEHFGTVKIHNRCCHHNPNLPEGSTIINNCAGCDRRFRSLYEGIKTISLWEVLDSIEDLPLPEYVNVKVSVHDSCSYRPKPQVHSAVRSLLRKMNVEIEEAEHHGTSSICCGDNFYPTIPLEKVREFQKNRAQQMPCDDVIVYCISCIKSMTVGGKSAHHMVDMVLGQPTFVGEVDLPKYHKVVGDYIEMSKNL